MTREIVVAGNVDAVAQEAARRFADAAGRAVAARGRFTVALSGGTAPKKLFALLAQAPYRESVDWACVHVFFADERFVPHDHPDSNFLLARQILLDPLSVPAENIHPMPFGKMAPEACAEQYASLLASFFPAAEPRFDLILLGMGPDGHTASLFPGRPDYPGWVAAVHDSPKPPPVRLTLTLDLINRAEQVIFLVTGADKEGTVRTVLREGSGGEPLPAARVKATGGKTVWLLDQAAGAGVMNRCGESE